MEPKIIEKSDMKLVGMTYFGPIGGKGWTAENQIGQLWQRFVRFWEAKGELLQGRAIDAKCKYEVAIWNEKECEETKSIYFFVGVEVDRLDDLPLQLVGRTLPGGTYAHFTPKGKEITTWENPFYNEWLPKSAFKVTERDEYQFQIQAYEEGRFKGLGDKLEESEIDVYIPLEKKL